MTTIQILRLIAYIVHADKGLTELWTDDRVQGQTERQSDSKPHLFKGELYQTVLLGEGCLHQVFLAIVKYTDIMFLRRLMTNYLRDK